MFKKKILKLTRSLFKRLLPLIFKILIKLKLNRRTINFLNNKSYNSNSSYNFTKIIENLLNDKKIVALDVEKLGNKKSIINKGLWSKKDTKKLYILGGRLGSSSMYEPDKQKFDLHNIKEQNYKNYDVTNTIKIECDSLNNLLTELDIKNLDYLKIDTQGAELEILSGIGNYRPLLIKVEAHIFSMYKDVPSWNSLLDYLYKLNYVVVDWKDIGEHNTRVPAEMDMILIPNFNNEDGKSSIINSKEKFISLMLIFGQLNLLKLILKRLNIDKKELEEFQDLYFN